MAFVRTAKIGNKISNQQSKCRSREKRSIPLVYDLPDIDVFSAKTGFAIMQVEFP